MIITSMFMIMTFHLMEIMILKEVDRISIKNESAILAVIDLHILGYLTIKWKLPSRFSVAEDILLSYQYPALFFTSQPHAKGI